MDASQRILSDFLKDPGKRERARAKRRAELHNKKINPELRLVAWVDILGFSQELQQANTDRDFSKVYKKMLYVHNVFDGPNASDEPESQKERNASCGRTVLALSDGLVVATAPNSEVSKYFSPYDHLMGFIGDILEAQARCALRGIFLRGGISIGPFYYENDILLSPALVRAYKLESRKATYPAIIAKKDDMDAIAELEGVECYAKGAVPSRNYFKKFKSPRQTKGERFYFLNYLDFIANPANHDFATEQDRIDFGDRVKFEPHERDEIFNTSTARSALNALNEHKNKILGALSTNTSSKVKSKFKWLMKYHNRTLNDYSPLFNEAKFSDSDLLI